jgi:hypothetical protein
MGEIHYYCKKTIDTDSDNVISKYFNAEYGERDVDSFFSKNVNTIVCECSGGMSMSLRYMYEEDMYRDRMLGVGYVTHYLVKMAGDKIQGIVKFKLNKDKKSIYVEYLCSIPQGIGTGKLLLDILKDFVRKKGFKSICLDMFNITLHEYYTKQGFRDGGVTECGRIWKPTGGGRRRTRRARKLYTRNNGRNKVLS